VLDEINVVINHCYLSYLEVVNFSSSIIPAMNIIIEHIEDESGLIV
jgi:hypothetical protein